MGWTSTRRALAVSTTLVAFVSLGVRPAICSSSRYRLADQVPDREQALGPRGIDGKLTSANPVHIMIEWKTGEGRSA